MKGKIRAAVAGAASYTGGELLRILSMHPRAEASFITSGTFEGRPASAAHPFLADVLDLSFRPYEPGLIRQNCDVVFLAKPQPSSFGYVEDLCPGVKIIDLSAGFRFRDKSVFEKWYGMEHLSPGFLSEAVYGLPELEAGTLPEARLVANPGCYPTGALLALAPLLAEKVISAEGICINAVSGFSGAGKGKSSESNFAPEIFSNIKPYRLTDHPHTPEIEEGLSRLAGGEVRVTFAPHVAGFERGILSTIYAGIASGSPCRDFRALYGDYYAGKKFVRFREEAGRAEIKDVVYTNFCDIGIKLNERTGRVIITSAIDNLVKGAAGQAVQNMNIMFGLPEETGMLPGGGND